MLGIANLLVVCCAKRMAWYTGWVLSISGWFVEDDG